MNDDNREGRYFILPPVYRPLAFALSAAIVGLYRIALVRQDARDLARIIMASVEQVVKAMLPGLIGRSVGGTLLTIGHCVFAYHVFLMFRGAKPRQGLPPFHEVAPIITRREKAKFVAGGRP